MFQKKNNSKLTWETPSSGDSGEDDYENYKYGDQDGGYYSNDGANS